jgi:hypothetical protein
LKTWFGRPTPARNGSALARAIATRPTQHPEPAALVPVANPISREFKMRSYFVDEDGHSFHETESVRAQIAAVTPGPEAPSRIAVTVWRGGRVATAYLDRLFAGSTTYSGRVAGRIVAPGVSETRNVSVTVEHGTIQHIDIGYSDAHESSGIESSFER